MNATCSRCGARLLPGSDGWGSYLWCVHCGVYVDQGIASAPQVWVEAEPWLPPKSTFFPPTDRRPRTRGRVPRRSACP